LSATVTPHIQTDIIKALNKPHIKQHIYPIDRDNIALTITEVATKKQKTLAINELLTQYHVPTLIYFSSREEAEKMSIILAEANPTLEIAFYHGGMEQMERIMIQQQFMNDQLH